MASAPLAAQDKRDAGVSVAPGKFKTESELRADANWWGKPGASTTAYSSKDHFA